MNAALEEVVYGDQRTQTTVSVGHKIDTTMLTRASQLVSGGHLFPVQSNKAIVGVTRSLMKAASIRMAC